MSVVISELNIEHESWDFRDSNIKEYTHCFHKYPAMMIPQIARKLINRYGVKGGWLFDPYCGTGTSLVEASMFGMHSVGCDINPLVRLIASAKLTPICLVKLDETLNKLNNRLLEIGFRQHGVTDVLIPDIHNLTYWFSETAIRYIAYLRDWINKIEDESIRNFLLVVFSETVREVSYARNGEFKLYRMSADKLENFKPNVFDVFSKKLSRNRYGLAAFLEKRKSVEVSVSDANTVQGELPIHGPLDGYDIVVTSPPYGDSHTTVAYGQFSRLSAEWIGLLDARQIDNIAMGGVRSKETLTDCSVSVAINKIRDVDEKRAQEVSAFYIDLESSISSIAQACSSHATICYVVGNRRVKDVVLPTDEFVVESFSQYGFVHETTIVRNISNKRMPNKNSPSNIVGKTSTTINEEYIVVCQR